MLEFIKLGHKTGVHLEITTLVVPDLNDSAKELSDIAQFIANTQGALAAIPWHLSAYHPDYRWNAPPTDPNFLLRAAAEARKKLRYVYTGNIASFGSGGDNDTLCDKCGATLVRRRGYRVDAHGLADGAVCAKCGEKTGIVW